MKHKQNTFLEKKLPPFSGLVLVAIMLVTISWLTGNVVLFGTKAATEGEPKKVHITNVSDTSFTVTYQTDVPVLGSIGYGPTDTLGNIGLDDRDQVVNKASEHRMHHITVKNLTPSSKYVFAISSGGKTYKNNNNFYEVVTAPTITERTSITPLTGQVTLDDGSIPVEGIVEVTTDSSQTLTALLQPDGSYTIPLQTLRNKDLATWTSISSETQLQVTVSSPTQQATAVLLGDQANPAPLMVLSQSYDFSVDDTQLAATEATGSATPGELTVPVDTTNVTSPTITTPTAGQAFNDLQPMFEGKALPQKEVIVTIQSQSTLEVAVQSDANGNWQYRPEVPLTPGNYTVIIKSTDAQGAVQTLSRSFTVFAEGSQFIEPSISPVLPTPIQQITPTTEPIITPTGIPTSFPTIAVTPGGLNPTISPIAVPSTPPINPPVPNSGSSSWILGLVGIFISAGVGTLLFFFI